MDFDLNIRYLENSLSVDSPQMKKIQACAHENNIVVALGFSERHNNSLYIAQCTIDKTGEIVMKRRKMMPTHMERTVFGNSSGESLNNVVETGAGKVGQLACWEHVQPLLKYHTITQHERIHVAAWPPVFPYAGPQELWSMTKEGEYCRIADSCHQAETVACRNEFSLKYLRYRSRKLRVDGYSCIE